MIAFIGRLFKSRFSGILFILCLLQFGNAQIKGYPLLVAPQEVYDVAQKVLLRETHGEPGNLGIAIRHFYRINCDSLQAQPSMLNAFAIEDDEAGRAEWYIPVFAGGSLHGIIQVAKYPEQVLFKYAGYSNANDHELAIQEIIDYWVRIKKMHPMLISCGSATMFHIPELGINNLTFIPNYPQECFDTPEFRKSRYFKFVKEHNALSDAKKQKELWREYIDAVKGKEASSSLKKILTTSSEFETVDSIAVGLKHLRKFNPGQ